MYILKLKHHFDAAHNLKNYKGACANLHGHRWEVLVELKVKKLTNDMVVDFKDLKSLLNIADHCYLNEQFPDINPTAENLTKEIHKAICWRFSLDAEQVRVTIWESPEASITYISD